MKKIILSLLVLTFSSLSQADEYPYDPICRKYNASSETVTMDSNPNGKLVLCSFGINSLIENRSIAYAGNGFGNMAVQTYARNTSQFGRQCYQDGAFLQSAMDTKGRSYNLCVFSDFSVMEQQTFGNGPNSAFNTQLNGALGIR